MGTKLNFGDLMDANNAAFESMGEIRTRIQNKNLDDLIKTVNETYDSIIIMTKEYLKIKPEAESELANIITNTYKNTLKLIKDAKSKANSHAYYNLLKEDKQEGIYKVIEELPPEFEKEDYKLAHINTLHGLIRYLHQQSLTGTFNAKELEYESNLCRYKLNKGTFLMMDLDNQIKQEAKNNEEITREDILNKPLQAVLNFYERNEPSQERETYYAFLKKNSVNLHLKLYQHSAEIDATFNENNSEIKFTYNEFLNDAWRERICYIKKGMELLGFNVNKAKREMETDRSHKSEMIKAEKKGVDEKSAEGTLTEMVRLLSSTTHINCGFERAYGLIDHETALKLFFQGTTNIYDKMAEINLSYHSYPKPPWYEHNFASEYQGKTFEEKVEQANKKYQPKVDVFWKQVENKKIELHPELLELKKKSLKELAEKRRKKYNITR